MDSVPSFALRSGDLSVYNYPIKNPGTGAAFPGNAYANMETLGVPPLTVEQRRDVMKSPSRTARAEII